jgi:hypothetical protein
MPRDVPSNSTLKIGIEQDWMVELRGFEPMAIAVQNAR